MDYIETQIIRLWRWFALTDWKEELRRRDAEHEASSRRLSSIIQRNIQLTRQLEHVSNGD